MGSLRENRRLYRTSNRSQKSVIHRASARCRFTLRTDAPKGIKGLPPVSLAPNFSSPQSCLHGDQQTMAIPWRASYKPRDGRVMDLMHKEFVNRPKRLKKKKKPVTGGSARVARAAMRKRAGRNASHYTAKRFKQAGGNMSHHRGGLAAVPSTPPHE